MNRSSISLSLLSKRYITTVTYYHWLYCITIRKHLQFIGTINLQIKIRSLVLMTNVAFQEA